MVNLSILILLFSYYIVVQSGTVHNHKAVKENGKDERLADGTVYAQSIENLKRGGAHGIGERSHGLETAQNGEEEELTKRSLTFANHQHKRRRSNSRANYFRKSAATSPETHHHVHSVTTKSKLRSILPGASARNVKDYSALHNAISNYYKQILNTAT